MSLWPVSFPLGVLRELRRPSVRRDTLGHSQRRHPCDQGHCPRPPTSWQGVTQPGPWPTPPHCPPPTVDHSPLSLTGCWVTSPRGSKILFQRVTVATATWPRRSLVATGGLGWMQEISVLAKKGRTQPQGLRPVGTGGFAEELGPHDASSPLPAQAWPQFIAPAPPCREPAVTHTGGW